MVRGEVHFLSVPLPDRGTSGPRKVNMDKLVVILRGGPTIANETDVPILVASTDRRVPGQGLRNFEVAVGVAEGFANETLIDCRWVYTLLKSEFPQNSYRFTLPHVTLERIWQLSLGCSSNTESLHRGLGV